MQPQPGDLSGNRDGVIEILPYLNTGFSETVLGRAVNDAAAGSTIIATLLAILSTLWTIYVVVAYILALILLYLYIYASIKLKELEDGQGEYWQEQELLYQKHFGGATVNARWAELQRHIDSANPNDWKLAIIEADIMLDDALKNFGYAGVSLGEKLKSISPTALRSIDDAWEAHKVRNDIAHAGADFVLTHKMARETIMRYQRVFEELGVV